MPYRKRSDSKKSLVRFTRRIGIAAFVVLAVVAIGLLLRSMMPREQAVSQKAPLQPAVAEVEEPAEASSEISGKYFGLCKKNSINSVQDLRRTVRNDSVLSAHFSGFNWESAKLGKLDKEVWTLVSYRIGDDIRRTSKPVRLPEGDGYVTDGVRTVRTYCCNDYVIVPPPALVSAAPPAPPVERVDGPPRRINKIPEPPVDPLRQLISGSAEDEPEAVPAPLSSMPSFPALPQTHGGSGYLPYSSSKHGTTRHDEPPPIVVPEPGMFLLTGGGAAVLVLMGLIRRRRSKLR
jgi:hypothetical protein